MIYAENFGFTLVSVKLESVVAAVALKLGSALIMDVTISLTKQQWNESVSAITLLLAECNKVKREGKKTNVDVSDSNNVDINLIAKNVNILNTAIFSKHTTVNNSDKNGAVATMVVTDEEFDNMMNEIKQENDPTDNVCFL